MNKKKRFWKGSLTWISDKNEEEKIISMLKDEFTALDKLYKYDTDYCRPRGIILCGYHYTCLLKVLGWNEWESTDIYSFHNNYNYRRNVYSYKTIY